MLEKKDLLSQNDTDIFSINFNKNGNSGVALNQNVTFDTFRSDLNALYGLGFIKKEFYKEMKEEISEIEKQYNKEHKNVVKKLNELLKEIKKEKKLNTYASGILISDTQALINNL